MGARRESENEINLDYYRYLVDWKIVMTEADVGAWEIKYILGRMEGQLLWEENCGMQQIQELTQANKQVFSLRAPTQPVKPMVKVISPGETNVTTYWHQQADKTQKF